MKQIFYVLFFSLFMVNVGSTQDIITVDLAELTEMENDIKSSLDQLEDYDKNLEAESQDTEEMYQDKANVTQEELVRKRLARAEMERANAKNKPVTSKMIKLGSGRKMNCQRFSKKSSLRIERAAKSIELMKAKGQMDNHEYKEKKALLEKVKEDVKEYKKFVGIS